MSRTVSRGVVVGAMFLTAAGVAIAGAMVDTHRNVQAVDASGNCVHPLIGAPMLDGNSQPIEENKVQLTGIAIAAPGDLTDTASEYLLVVQGEGEDHAGTQLWSGIFFHDPGSWPEYAIGIAPGDRVRVTGFIMDFIGKANMNERHQGNPAVNFEIEVLGSAGMPEPEVIPSIAHADFFDLTRLSGGEYYQSRWVRMNSVGITGGEPWASGNQVTVSDGTGELGMMLSSAGDFDTYSPPVGKFDVLAVFDQEPHPLDFGGDKTANYRLWVKRWFDVIEPADSPMLMSAASRRTHADMTELDVEMPLSGTPGTESRAGGLATLVLTFSEGIKAIDGTLDDNEVSVSAGDVDAVTLDGLDLIVELSGIDDGTCVDVTVIGIEDLAGNALVGDRDLRVNVLAGDTNGSGLVDNSDMISVRVRRGQTVANPTAQYDINVDGVIDNSDLIAVRIHRGNGS